jgi:hypothetical protein
MVIGDVARNSQWETLCCAGRGSRFTAGRGSGRVAEGEIGAWVPVPRGACARSPYRPIADGKSQPTPRVRNMQ